MTDKELNEAAFSVSGPPGSNHYGRIDLGNQFDCSFGSHRSGWAFAVSALCPYHDPGAIYLDTFVERTYVWGEKTIIPDKKWVGIIHVPPYVPAWFDQGNTNEKIFALPSWQKSFSRCRGLFTLSKYHQQYLLPRLGLPIDTVLHPMEVPEKKWSIDAFLDNPKKRLVQIGWWLRNLHAIFELPASSYVKTFLKAKDDHTFDQIMRAECLERTRLGVFREEMYESTETLQFLSNRAYDELLVANLVFINLYDASANNTVVECIARNTPLLVNPIPPVVEYLGADYPLYYSCYDEAVEKAENVDLVYAAHAYLCNLKIKEKLSVDYFRETILSSFLLQEKREQEREAAPRPASQSVHFAQPMQSAHSEKPLEPAQSSQPAYPVPPVASAVSTYPPDPIDQPLRSSAGARKVAGPGRTLHVLTTTLNHGDTIDRAILSVLQQAGNFSLRYHLQDGGSNDGTVERIKHWQKRLQARELPLHCRDISLTYESISYESISAENAYELLFTGFGQPDLPYDYFMTWLNGAGYLLPGALNIIAAVDMLYPEIAWVGGSSASGSGERYALPDNNRYSLPGSDRLSAKKRVDALPTAVIRAGLCDDEHYPAMRSEGVFIHKSLWFKAKHVLKNYRFAGDWALWRECAAHAAFYQTDYPLGGLQRAGDPSKLKCDLRYRDEVEKNLPLTERRAAMQRLFEDEKLCANLLAVERESGTIALRDDYRAAKDFFAAYD